MTSLRWLTIGIVAAALVAVAALVVPGEGMPSTGLAASDPAGTSLTDRTSSLEAMPAGSASTVANAGPDLVEPPTTVFPADALDSEGSNDGDDAVAGTSAGASSGSSGGSAARAGIRLRIPVLGVDSRIVELGVQADGQLGVPWDAYSVGWYDISSAPGAAGNALLGGHLNWAGSVGVFDRLDELSPGDLIYVDGTAEPLVYRVTASRSVSADAALGEVLGRRSGPSTITLFTCGGSFDYSVREYDHRYVVTAERVLG
jgi:LPXTG-site transpeptidase (sortase) family protein